VEPIRVLQVVTIMNRGGLETMLMNYYRQMDRTKIQFDFMVHRDEEGHYDEEINNLGGKIYKMPPIKPGNYRRYFRMLDSFFISHPEYRVVHSHINENSSFVLRAAKKAGVSCRIAHSHTSNLGIDYKFLFRLYARLILKQKPNHYFACSSDAAHWLFGGEKVAKGTVSIIENAIEINRFLFNKNIREKMRNSLGLNNKLVIGHVGRFNKSKNHDFIIEVFNSLHKKYPNSVLLLVGNGKEQDRIEKKVSSLALSSSVKFLGARDDISDLMNAMDIFLFPSFFEGFPVVMIEAQASGLHCIVSNTINKDTNITGRVQYLSLKSSADYWSNEILKNSCEHIDHSHIFRNSNFDITKKALDLEEFYLANI
jgi:glycosyltransferase involved in cell wall biosynthesis